MSGRVIVDSLKLNQLANCIATKSGIKGPFSIDGMIKAIDSIQVRQVEESLSPFIDTVRFIVMDSPNIDLFAYVNNGIATVHANRVYIGGNTSGFSIKLPTAVEDKTYESIYGKKIQYVSSATWINQNDSRVSSVSIEGGTSYISVPMNGYYTFELSYPCVEE